MNSIIKDSSSLFANCERWNSFQELINHKEDIEKYWRKILCKSLEKRKTSINNDFKLYFENEDSDWRVFLGNDKNSVSICIEFYDKDPILISFWLHAEFYNLRKVSKEFDSIKSILYSNYPSISFDNEGSYLFQLKNFISLPNDLDKTISNYSWYAGNRTEEFAEKLINEINKILILDGVIEFFEKSITFKK